MSIVVEFWLLKMALGPVGSEAPGAGIAGCHNERSCTGRVQLSLRFRRSRMWRCPPFRCETYAFVNATPIQRRHDSAASEREIRDCSRNFNKGSSSRRSHLWKLEDARKMCVKFRASKVVLPHQFLIGESEPLVFLHRLSGLRRWLIDYQ